jgi:hypothetical protein
MIKCDVWIQGTSPLLQNRFPDPDLDGALDESPEVSVCRRAHFDEDGFLCFPSMAVSLLLRQVAFDEGAPIVPRSLVVVGDDVPLFAPDRKTRLEDFEVDARAVKCRRGIRRMCYRPRIDAWAAPITLLVQDKVLDPTVVRRLLIEGGQWVGLGDFRPQRGGQFGRFEVVRWNETSPGLDSESHRKSMAWEAPV